MTCILFISMGYVMSFGDVGAEVKSRPLRLLQRPR
jgi:hypothetical protein